MRRFLLQTLLFLIAISISVYLVLLKVGGYIDPYYLRFTSHKQSSLILGTSRAAQGLQPSVLNKILNRSDIYNYSFSIDASPFGPIYFNSIKTKMNPKTKNGIFILAVDPWSISSKCENPNDTNSFGESKLQLATTKFVNLNPNILYLLKNYNQPLYKLLFTSKESLCLHSDGWLEVSINMDNKSVQDRLSEKIVFYSKYYCPIYKFSTMRLKYFIKTIYFLNQYGKVYLVRLPIHPLMMKLDNDLVPDFDEKIRTISSLTSSPYLNLTILNPNLVYTDGNHLYKESGSLVSKLIAEWILDERNKNTIHKEISLSIIH